MLAGLKRIGMTALFAIFTLIGLGIALLGDGPDRLLGVGVILFMGGGGVAWFVVTADRPYAGLRIGTINALGRYETGFIADYDSRRRLVGACGALCMGAAAVLFGFVPDNEGSTVVPTWLGIGLGVLMLGIGVVGIAKAGSSSQLVLTPRGLAAVSATGPIFVPWSAIADIGEMEVRGSPFLVIRVTDPALVEMSRLQWLIHLIERSVMNVDLSFPMLALRTDPQQLRDALHRYLANPDLRRLIGTQAELAELPRDEANGGSETSDESRSPGTPASRIVAGVSLLLIGSLLALVSIAAAVDEVTPAQERGRLIGLALFLVVSLSHLAAGVMFLRGVPLGRWIGLVSALLALGLAGLGLVRSDDDSRTIAFVIVGVFTVHVALVLWGVIRWRGRETPGASPAGGTSGPQ